MMPKKAKAMIVFFRLLGTFVALSFARFLESENHIMTAPASLFLFFLFLGF